MTKADCFFWKAALLPVSSQVGESGGMSLSSHQPLMRVSAPTVSGLLRATLPLLSTSVPPSFQMMLRVLPKQSGVRPSVNPQAYRPGGLLIFLQMVVRSSSVLGGSVWPVACWIRSVRAKSGDVSASNGIPKYVLPILYSGSTKLQKPPDWVLVSFHTSDRSAIRSRPA